MQKILYIVTQSEFGGAQKNALDLACAFKDRYDISVAAGPDGGGELLERAKDSGLKTIELKRLRRSINPFYDLAAFFEIKNLLAKEKPDILHLHSSKAGVLGSLAARSFQPKIKVIYTVHGAVFEAPFNKLSRQLFLLLEKLTSRFKDKIICVSENDKNLWLKYQAAPSEKLIVIHNGIDFSRLEFLPKEAAKKTIAKLCNCPVENSRIIGTIANLYPEKGLNDLVEAADLIIKSGAQDVIFVVIGEGRERKKLSALIQKKGLQRKFILAGAMTQAARYLKAFDIFVLPSVKEGLPYTILEAVAAGLPIVACRVGGIPEIISDEKNCFLTPVCQPQILGEKISALLENPGLAQNLSQNYQCIMQNFSLEKMVRETKKVYENINS